MREAKKLAKKSKMDLPAGIAKKMKALERAEAEEAQASQPAAGKKRKARGIVEQKKAKKEASAKAAVERYRTAGGDEAKVDGEADLVVAKGKNADGRGDGDGGEIAGKKAEPKGQMNRKARRMLENEKKAASKQASAGVP